MVKIVEKNRRWGTFYFLATRYKYLRSNNANCLNIGNKWSVILLRNQPNKILYEGIETYLFRTRQER